MGDTIPNLWFEAWANMMNASAEASIMFGLGPFMLLTTQMQSLCEYAIAVDAPSRHAILDSGDGHDRKVLDIRTRKPYHEAAYA